MSARQLNLNITPLNTKAMLVRLSVSKPATSKRDVSAEQFTQSNLHDAGLKVSATLFKDNTNPVRQLLNSQSAVYHYHKLNTLPYIDRGPRLLPVARYEVYRDKMRALVGEVELDVKTVMPDYDTHVLADMALRGSRAKAEDYPTAAEFEASFKMAFTFSPLPDVSHFLFDVSEEDKAALTEQINEVESTARADLYARMRGPVVKLIDKLKVPAGDPGSIFRDTAVTNIVDAVDLCRQLAMDDEVIIAMCDDVSRTMDTVRHNPDVLRESPVVRDMAAAKLKAVSERMAFMMGGA